MTNTTTTIAPINRFMGLFTFVSSISYSPPSQAGSRTCIQEHSAILPSLAPLPNRLGQHKVGALIKEPGPLYAFRVSEHGIWRKFGFREEPFSDSRWIGASVLGRLVKNV